MSCTDNSARRGRVYHDPLHGAIALDGTDRTEALLIQLVDTPEFQRLRRIRQLGPASLTFHGAESSRFTHSLGVLAIARRAIDRLIHSCPELSPHRVTVLCTALLHDLGHGPFSHTCEEIFGSHHEHWTLRILNESTPLRSLLDAYDPELLQQMELVYRKQHPIPCVWQLVSSQLDCDRLDYLMRDSYFTGANYGKLDLDRILLALKFDATTQQLVVNLKGISAIEHYLVVRYFMYAQVYNHPKNLAATWVLKQAFGRAKELLAQSSGSIWLDPIVAAWLTQDCDHLSLDHYLKADDGVFIYHLQRWQTHDDPILSDFCRRFLDRDLLKVMEISHLAPEQQTHLHQVASDAATQLGFPVNYYLGMRTTSSSGYTLYQRGIHLKQETTLVDISERSPLVKTLTQPVHRSWLIFPREVATSLNEAII